MSKRRDKCKCGSFVVWDPNTDLKAKCRKCGTTYNVDADTVMIYWLVEEIKAERKPWVTDPR